MYNVFYQTMGVIVVGLTNRDLEVVRLLEKNMILSAEQIATLFFNKNGNFSSALTIARRRLSFLTEKKYIKRIKDYSNGSFVYFIGKTPNITKHKMLFGDVLVTLKKHKYEINDVRIEYRGFYDEGFKIIPDMRIDLVKDGVTFSLFVEVDYSKKFTNGKIYRDILRQRNSINCLKNTPFAILSVCDSALPHEVDFKVAHTTTKLDQSILFEDLLSFIYYPENSIELSKVRNVIHQTPTTDHTQNNTHTYKFVLSNGISYIVKSRINSIDGVIASVFSGLASKNFKITKWELDCEMEGMNSVVINSNYVSSIEYYEQKNDS